MTVPNVTMTHCQRRAQCEYCPDLIDAGTPLVTVFFWNRGGPEHKGFNVKKYYHPDCWIAQGLNYLKNNPYVPYQRKKKMELTPEQSAQRYIILKRKAAIDQRKRNLEGRENNITAMVALDIKIADLIIEIAPLGGVPSRWLNQCD